MAEFTGRQEELAKLDRHLAGERDVIQLARARSVVPGADEAALVAVARTGCTAKPDAFYSATDLLPAWP